MNTLLGIDEPGAYELINPGGRSQLVLVCDHASNRLPTRLGDLGLAEEHLASHIGWDPGAALLTRSLCARLDTVGLLSNYSRLVIDCNRNPAAADSIPASSHGLLIPGNARLHENELQLRRRELFTPYHEAIRQMLNTRAGQPTRMLSIHSFTPALAGSDRPWPIGVCYRLDLDWAAQWLSALRAKLSEPVGDNQPYAVELNIDYTLPVHCEARGMPGIMLEIRQDQLQDEDAVHRWSELIAECWMSMA